MSQKTFVKKQLEEHGEISRNFCLRNYISRLGAIICDLKKEGYQFITENRGGDYVYKLYKPEQLNLYEHLQEPKKHTGNLYYNY